MASLNKLAIRGIRSFDDKQIAVIEFFSPVTVIVGHNGSGKTTVIECLKYATTGDQPPNTRGGAFVHDPKMANEKEVKAQVKLRFTSASGVRMLAVRNLSVTVKKTSGLTMKTLESILALADQGAEKGGKRGVISTKCAEMDTEIPALLGVSKSVLENVIFCHQEDSYWPLSEPAALKKKFDDIFEATRYTKALDSIKSLRKDRVAELKSEKERLESLSREKSHSDKLKGRIAGLTSEIEAKEIEHEETTGEYKTIMESNNQHQLLANKFREMYNNLETLEAEKKRYKEDLAEGRSTEEELKTKLRDFDENIEQQKQKHRQETKRQEKLEEELSEVRRKHVNENSVQGGLAAEVKAQEQRVSDRDSLINELSLKHEMKGFQHKPLTRQEVLDFSSQLESMKNRQAAHTTDLSAELTKQTEAFNTQHRKLSNESEKLKIEQKNMSEKMNSLQQSISQSHRKLGEGTSLDDELADVKRDIEDKTAALKKAQAELAAGNFPEKLEAATAEGRNFEVRRDALNEENRALSAHAEMRAKYNLNREVLDKKKNEVNTTLATEKDQFRKLIGANPEAGTMEREVGRVVSEKEREVSEMEERARVANRESQQVELMRSNFLSSLKAKEDELGRVQSTIDEAMSENEHPWEKELALAREEVAHLTEMVGVNDGSTKAFNMFLETGRKKHKCGACSRDMDDKEMVTFEKTIATAIKKYSPESVKQAKLDLASWTTELKRLEGLKPYDDLRTRLSRQEIPKLKKELHEHNDKMPAITEESVQAAEKLRVAKEELRALTDMKQRVGHVTRLLKEIQRLSDDIVGLEDILAASGSKKTADDIAEELNGLSERLRSLEKTRMTLTSTRDRLNTHIRLSENTVHSLQMKESNLKNQIGEHKRLEGQIDTLRAEVTELVTKIRDIKVKIDASRQPIDILEAEHSQSDAALSSKIKAATEVTQSLNISCDHIQSQSKSLERHSRAKYSDQLKDSERRVQEYERRIGQLGQQMDALRLTIGSLDKEVNESGAFLAGIRENLRLRKLERDIVRVDEAMSQIDINEASKARRTYQDKFATNKIRENQLQTKCAHLGGEIKASRSQLKTWNGDLKEFKDINKKYTDQLIKVKMSDMANADLEKYAKALENAIMKYHGLKMEEVNDTMKHLWNKTYQGTDIDGIKIRSDVEGGGTAKRTYHYRVVMTKDQVEMDMRGRCSAGQKMLASIIIRLALSDSFGQNCGILALDEPTNALDTENIDALATSLVDIINERKNHSNFQLIIITHDEGFLQKLGQNDVMEHYWRVSRDSRQKSVITRERFR